MHKSFDNFFLIEDHKNCLNLTCKDNSWKSNWLIIGCVIHYCSLVLKLSCFIQYPSDLVLVELSLKCEGASLHIASTTHVQVYYFSGQGFVLLIKLVIKKLKKKKKSRYQPTNPIIFFIASRTTVFFLFGLTWKPVYQPLPCFCFHRGMGLIKLLEISTRKYLITNKNS